MQKNKYYYILTFGCQMNKNDSERISGLLTSIGLKETKTPKKADVLFINTCSVRQHAEDRVFGFVREWQKFRINKPNLIVGITGCLPGRDKDGKLQKKLPGVDLFFPINELPTLARRLHELNPGLFPGSLDSVEEYWQIEPKLDKKYSAFVTIQNGCNNFCTYCVVPYARGQEKNRPLKEILKEIKALVKNGCLEVTLLGQVVNNYQAPDKKNFSKNNLFCHPELVSGSLGMPKQVRHDSMGTDHFAALLWEINQIKGLKRIHWTAADPQYFSDQQIQALTLLKQVNFLHLPVQSGNNQILKKMNRKYTRENYLKLVKKIKKVRPEIALGTDFIVGFCAETKKQFLDTVDLYKKCDFDISYHAQYSARSGTVAAKMFKDNVSREEKKRRWQVLQDLMEEITYRKNQKYLGQKNSVLVDNFVDGWCSGNSEEMKLTRFRGVPKMIGTIQPVKIIKTSTWILWAEKL
ncbi:MAG: (Dimethylallyl)adenosine tRNA methylthiotransferase MiaB [Candidatus Magasanikbacteria bacterium GW2011_GWC2_37_14]|uniref:tRNA-2-methylthio-N(6)-dimethylallyladenosine synthase n=1 Tax=Candidatus Magasanikbacteria bacterium GW2011_GWC2_37_14 TaxID=1619046 RepID=A0A0G0ISC7_9BACT|nr:MAG: (Dimethylallyl)adenosine tRNA methylthiotransferase MiaB [Candidatus Magasanikbacteria bacterium GW2011_GWC2_37_14]